MYLFNNIKEIFSNIILLQTMSPQSNNSNAVLLFNFTHYKLICPHRLLCVCFLSEVTSWKSFYIDCGFEQDAPKSRSNLMAGKNTCLLSFISNAEDDGFRNAKVKMFYSTIIINNIINFQK